MSDYAIRVQNLSKHYTLGQIEPYKTLRESLTRAGRRLMSRMTRPEARVDDKSFWALKDVSFDIKQGEVVGIIGRNGAGKSTLLKILSRITEPTAGQVELHGRVGSLLEVGTGFHPELTGRENIYLNGAILGMTRGEITRRFDEIVAFSEVEKFLDTPVKRYSSGMYVRLAFAVAAHLEPEILIVDEVLAVGDAEFQKKCLGKMSGVAQSGRTVLFVSHNMAAVRSLCQSGCYLADGMLKFRGPMEACADAYLNVNAAETATHQFAFEKPSRASLWIREARLLANGENSANPQMGDSFAVEVEFQSETPIDRPHLGITLYASDGACIINTNNRFQQAESYPMPVTSGTIRCDFGSIPLVAGRYFLSLWLGDAEQNTHVVDRGIRFEVRERDLWGLGKTPSSKTSYLWWPAKFNLIDSAAPLVADRAGAETQQ
jgi:lipopolysaccharide transport system ATP-binding protein